MKDAKKMHLVVRQVMSEGAPVEGSLVSMKSSLTKAVNLGKGCLY